MPWSLLVFPCETSSELMKGGGRLGMPFLLDGDALSIAICSDISSEGADDITGGGGG